MKYRSIQKLSRLFATAMTLLFCATSFGQSSGTNFVAPNYNLHHGFYISPRILPPVAGGFDIGYLFTPYVGLDAGVDSLWGWAIFSIETVTMYHLGVKGILPLGSRFEFFGKLGLGLIHGREQDNFLGFQSDTSSESLGASIGGGMGYSFTPKWVGTLEANGMIYPKSAVLRGGIAVVPMIGFTHYF